MNLLIVEDDNDISESLYDIFEERGYFVWRAGNGREAIEIAAREAFHPDVILLDLRMPVMDGIQFLRLRGSVPMLATSQVIVMTAQPEILDELEGAVFEWLAKPLGLEQVLEAVKRACDAPTAAAP